MITITRKESILFKRTERR